MKIRAVLNGVTALAAVGAFYTFAFCMVDDVDDAAITKEKHSQYYYNTATQTVTSPAETMLASANRIIEETYNREAAEMPMDNDLERVNQVIGVTYGYEASPQKAETEGDIDVTPLFSTQTEAQTEVFTTVVPYESPETATESAGAAVDTEPVTEVVTEAETSAVPETVVETESENFDLVPEEGADIIVSDNMLDAADSYSDALHYQNKDNVSIDEINEKMAQMQQSLTTAETTAPVTSSLPESYTEFTLPTFAPTPTTVISSGTFFETIPYIPETSPVTSESIVSQSPAGNEIFTAKIGGVVGEYDAYELVRMIVSTEMSPSFSPEALKAQAVAAYSYVKYHNVNGLVPSVLVKKDIPDEVTAAVDAVWGKCCYYNGEVAQTVYTASTAGRSAASENVWGGKVPYLVSVDTPNDAAADPNYGVISTYSQSDMKYYLENSLGITLSEDPANWLTVTSTVDGKYVSGVNVDNQITISGRKLRESVLKYGIKSWAFDVSYADGEFTFITYGYGHGVGMSQNGANYLGKQGYTYDQILKYYFTGITVE